MERGEKGAHFCWPLPRVWLNETDDTEDSGVSESGDLRASKSNEKYVRMYSMLSKGHSALLKGHNALNEAEPQKWCQCYMYSKAYSY